MKTKTIKHQVFFRRDPKELYGMLMDSRKHAAFTHSKTRISRKVGGTFSVYDGDLRGVNLELVPGKKIVQSWRADMEEWPSDHYSQVVFSFRRVRGGTRLMFRQTGVPVRCFSKINEGWKEYYWKPMKELLKESRNS